MLARPRIELADKAVAGSKKRSMVDSLGRDLGSPWDADQKNAALLAWLVLATA
jgi:hypothetical protein